MEAYCRSPLESPSYSVPPRGLLAAILKLRQGAAGLSCLHTGRARQFPAARQGIRGRPGKTDPWIPTHISFLSPRPCFKGAPNFELVSVFFSPRLSIRHGVSLPCLLLNEPSMRCLATSCSLMTRLVQLEEDDVV